MAYNLTLNNQQLQLSLARTGGQGSQGNSVTSASIDSNGDFHIIISNASGQQVQDINLGGANIVASVTAAKNAAEAALDTFDDRFLGVKSSAPGLDNDNDALVTGALYFDSTISHLGVYNGSTWIYPLQAAQTSATAAAASETAAATSETNAGTSETNAATSATNAANSAAQAASSESTVAASATTASTAATNALASQSAAASSEANAATSETNAGTSETNAGNSATAAAASGVYADNRATAAAVSAAAALVSENNSATSESSAASSATTAGIHSANAAANAVSANSSKTAAATSETNALNYQSDAQTFASNAATSETNAASSATAAATSATNSASSATASATSASAAQTAQAATELAFDNFDDKFLGTKASDPTVDNDGNALVEGSMYYNSTDNVIKFYSGSAWQAPSVTATNAATSATTSASNASTSATNAATSETNAATSAASSLTSANNAAASYDSFDDRYLGAKSSAPTTDNDGNSLLTGALYWNSTLDKMYVYTGAIWTVATGSIPGIKMEFVYTATAGQTAFTGSDDNSETLVMDDTKLVDVFLNGIRLVKGTDYTLNLVTDTVTFATGRTVNDMVVVQVFGNLVAAGVSISGANLTGGTINNAVIGGTTPAAGSFTTITATGTIDGRDVAADGTKLDGIETSADVTDTANVTAAGALMTTGGTMTGNISLGDSDRVIFGSDSDLFISHTGVVGRIASENGTIQIQARAENSSVVIQADDQDGSYTDYFKAAGGSGAAQLFFADSGSSSVKLQTSSTGVDVTGTLTATDLILDGGTSSSVFLQDSTATNGYQLRANVSSSVDGGLLIEDLSGKNIARFDQNNDISFYEDTGTTPKFFWDASAESLGIGHSSAPTSMLAVGGNPNTTTKPTVTVVDTTNGASMTLRGQSPKLSFDITSGGVGKILMDGAGIEFKDGTLDAEGNVDLKIDSSGNVGIGTSSPEALLDVAYNLPDDTNGIIRPLKLRTTDLLNQTNLLAGDGVGILFEIPDQSSGSVGASIDAVKAESADDDISTDLVFRTSANNETLVEHMRLNNAGKLSLGNNLTNPDNSLLHLTQNNANNFSILQLESTEGGSSTAPDIALYRNSASPADGDNIGQILFYANNSIGDRTTFGGLYYTLTDVTDGSEDSKFKVFAQQAGTYREFLTVGSNAGGTGEVCVNDASGDINFRVETNANANAFVVDAGTEFIGMHTGSALAPNGYTERVRIASDGNNQGGSLVMSANNSAKTGDASENDLIFYDQDTTASNGQGIGNIRWYSRDPTGGGEGYKLGIKGRVNAAGTAYFQFYTSSSSTNYTLAADLSGNVFQAGTDNNSGLGQSSKRWTDVWSVDGSINTSDERLKQQVASLTTDEINAAKAISALFKTYKWNHGVAEKGDNARIHSGVIAQQVKAAMEANSLDPMKYAFMCWNEFYEKEMSGEDIATPYVETFEVDDPEIPEGSTYVDRYSIRYSELMSFIHAATEQRLASIESRLAALEAE